MNPSAIDLSPGPQFPPALVLAAVVGLGLVFLIVRDLVVRDRAARPAPAAPPGGPNAVQQVFAGLALFVLIPFGLLAVGIGLPAWQKRTMTGHPPGPVEYAVLAGVAALYLAVLVKLFRVLTARTGAAAPATPVAPVAPPAARFTPRERRFLAVAVPFGVVAVAASVAVWLAADFRARSDAGLRDSPAVQGALGVLGAVILAAAVLHRRLSRWAYPEWWANRDRLLYLAAAAATDPAADRARRQLWAGLGTVLVFLLWAGWVWAQAFDTGLSVPRRNSKDQELQLLSIAGLFGVAVGAGVVLHRWAGRPAPAASPGPAPAVVSAVADVPAPGRDCPKCGRPVAAGSPAGLCPRCLLGGVIPSPTAPGATIGFVEAYVAPPVEDVRKLFPHLTVERLIGQGGMGAVYLARQTALDRPVALKLVRPRPDDPTFAERFVREAKALARMNHPNVVTVYESGDAGGLPYLLMEYVPGPTLRDLMRDKALTPAAALAIIPQICDALEYAHRQGVVHRDIKPENILLWSAEPGTRNGEPQTGAGSGFRVPGSALKVKIADFGLAKVADPAGVSLTGTHQAMGTPHYMAPEQWEKPGEVDHRADIYALGVVLYELLTGELPLGRFDPPSQKVRLDIRVDEVVLRALAKEPGRRYQHASDVKLELEAIRAGGGAVRRVGFYEYQSKARFLGLPLVHVVRGLDPETGRMKTARGWLAVGDAGAVGGLALGGAWAAGLVALSGAVSFGVLSAAGGLAVGFMALAGGGAAGVLAAFAGGFAAAQGVAAAGGFAAAVQYAAAGGGAAARWVWSSQRQDTGFWESLTDWLKFWEADVSDW